MPAPLVIGIGNAFAGDDAAGLEVAARLSGPFDVVADTGIAADLVALFEHRDHVILVDACRSDNAATGTIRHFDAARETLPAFLDRLSSHGIGVAEAVELARALNLLPARCEVWAIEGARFAPGDAMSPAVLLAVNTCAGQIADAFT